MLGGVDFDKASIAHVVEEFKRSLGVTLSSNKDAAGRVRHEFGKRNRQLSLAQHAIVLARFHL